jgi:hypothetical protein
MDMSTLAEWENFYVITGSAAAGLTGLTFVVIALAKDSRRTATSGLRAYVTPTIVHFSTVLALAAFLSMPGQNAISLGLGFGVAGLGGLLYAAVIVASMRRYASRYVPVGEDWLWHSILPAAVYAALLVIAFLTRRWLQQSLYGIAVASLLLLFIGIHNAWDVAVSISMTGKKDSSEGSSTS